MHNIFLSKEQRYSLHAGIPIQVVGVQVPVWHQHGFSSEPAAEVFCRYVLLNEPEGGTEIKMSSWGYEFNMPQQSHHNPLPKIDLDEWRSMTREQQDEWHGKFPQRPTSMNLLDPNDGGSGELSFNQKAIATVNGSTINVLHYVRISTTEILKESLI